MNLPVIGYKIVDLDLAVLLKDGSAGTVTSVDVGLSPPGGDSHSVVAWLTVPVVVGVATFALLGFHCPASTGTYKITVPVIGADLWARVTDNPEIDAEMIDHIRPI